jgi:hypothetical protein
VTAAPGVTRSGGGEDWYRAPVVAFRRVSTSYANKMAEAAGYPDGAEEWKDEWGADSGDDIYIDANGNFFAASTNQSLVPPPEYRLYLGYADGSSTYANEQPMKTVMGPPAYNDDGGNGYGDGGDDGFPDDTYRTSGTSSSGSATPVGRRLRL